VPVSIPDKKEFLLKNRIALWDVIAQCDIQGSSDSSIKNVVPNDMGVILQRAPIQGIYANGNKASELYEKYCYPVCGRRAVRLPSTSPANAAYGTERLIRAWEVLLQTDLSASKISEV
jgi:hypoxanthine-DNA glycosylase